MAYAVALAAAKRTCALCSGIRGEIAARAAGTAPLQRTCTALRPPFLSAAPTSPFSSYLKSVSAEEERKNTTIKARASRIEPTANAATTPFVSSALCPRALRQYPAFILWNGGDGLRLAVPKGAKKPEGRGWSLAKRGEPRPWPAAPLTEEDLAKEKLLGALIASPVPLGEAKKNYGRFMRNYRRAQALAQMGKGKVLEELEKVKPWWEEAERYGFEVYACLGLRFLDLGEEVKVGFRERAALADLAKRAKEGDEKASKAWERLAKPAVKLLEAKPKRLRRTPLWLTRGQLERLLHALSVAYREDRGGIEVFLAEDFSIAVRLGAGNSNLLVVGESQTGKSTLVGCLLAQLARWGWPKNILILDWTGEYTFLEKCGFRVLEALDPVCNPLALGPAAALEILQQAAYEAAESERGKFGIWGLRETERALMEAEREAAQELEAAVKEGSERGGTLIDVVRALEKRLGSVRTQNERDAVQAALNRVELFLHPALCAREWVLPEGRVVVDLSRLPGKRVKKAVGLTMLRMILAGAEGEHAWRGLVVVDEIHNYIVPTPAGPDCPVVTDIANQLSKHGVAVWAVGQQYHRVPVGLQGARAIAVFRQTHAEALRAIELSMGREAAEIMRNLPPRQFYLFADCSVPAVRAPPPIAEKVAPLMAASKASRENKQLDFQRLAARLGFEYADLVELYVRYLPHARALARFALRAASPEELAEVRSLDLEAKVAMKLGELYAIRYGLLPPSGERLGA